MRTRQTGRAGQVVDVERLEEPGIGQVLGPQQVAGWRDERHAAEPILSGVLHRSRLPIQIMALLLAAAASAALAGCGSSTTVTSTAVAAGAGADGIPRAHPQAIEPVA